MEDGGSSGKHLNEKTCVSNNKRVVFKSVISTVIPDHGSGSRPDSETNLEGSGHGSGKDSDSFYSVSSTSSNSTSDDFIQVNPQILPKFRVQKNIPKPKRGTKPLYKNEKPNVSSEVVYRLKESVNEPPKSIPRVSDVAHESLVPHVSPTQPPTSQVMERTGGFDPDRIPASIFCRPSATPLEWSAASNDSLFSIHLGNSSFSRDHMSSMDVDLQQSGDLFKSEELCQPGEPSKSAEIPQSRGVYNSGELYQSIEHVTASNMKRSGDLIGLGQTFPTTEGAGHKKSSGMAKSIGDNMSSAEMGTIAEPISYVPTTLMNEQVDINIGEPMDSPNTNCCHSDKSGIAFQPSPYPRKKKSSCLPSHCSDCCRIFCCCKWSSCSCNLIHRHSCFTNCLSWKSSWCKWPSCYCKCPSWPSCKIQCSNCAWACCCCWNHEPQRVCCDSSHVLTDGRINA